MYFGDYFNVDGSEGGEYLVDHDTNTFTPTSFTMPSTSDYPVGIWMGSVPRALVFKVRPAIFWPWDYWAKTMDLDYHSFYVVDVDDSEMANKYSIFSGLYGDDIVHIEGLEDVTPTVWRGNTKLADLN